MAYKITDACLSWVALASTNVRQKLFPREMLHTRSTKISASTVELALALAL